MTTTHARAEAASPVDARRRGLELVTRSVRIRFALDADSFADRLVDLTGVARADQLPSLYDQLSRLSLDDLYLATACTRGDEHAWEEFGTRYFGFIRDFARRSLREPIASDVADQVIANLWQRGTIARYEGRSTLRTWLGAVVAHAAINATKAERRMARVDSEELENWRSRQAVEPPAVETTAELLAQLVREAIENLPAEDRLLLFLYYEQSLTLEEMGLVLRASKPALSRRLKRTREALRTSVEAMARQRVGASADSLREGLDLSRLELDLGTLIVRQPGMEKNPRRSV